MAIQFQCLSCQKHFSIDESLAGKKIRCKACQGVMRVPQTHPVAEQFPEIDLEVVEEDEDPDDFVPLETEWIVECDDCGRQHRPPEKLMGKRIRCRCGSILLLSENPQAGLRLQPLPPEPEIPVSERMRPIKPPAPNRIPDAGKRHPFDR